MRGKQSIYRFFSRKNILPILLGIFTISGLAFSGSLTPPSSPASTMRTLQELYNSIAGTFNSSSIIADQNGSLIQGLKYIQANIGVAGIASDSLDFSHFKDAMDLDANTTIASSGFSFNIMGNVGIGTSTPETKLEVVGAASISSTLTIGGSITNSPNITPVQVGLISSGVGTPFNVDVVNNIAYVADFTDVRIIDISNPASPSLMSTIVTPGTAQWVQVVGRYAYVADGTAMRIYDISNPASASSVGSVAMSSTFHVTVSGKYAYVSDNGAGAVKVVDVSNPAAPTLVFTSSALASSPYMTYVSGNLLFIARNNFGFQIWDITNPRLPTSLSGIDPGNTRGIHAIGRYLYAVGTSGFNVYDIKNPASPVLLSTDTSVTGYKLVSSGKYLYLFNGGTGLRIYDVTNPAVPVVVGAFAGGVSIVWADIVGRYAYVADVGGQFRVIDIGGIETRSLTAGTIQSGNINIWDEAVIGGNLYVRTGLNIGTGGLLSAGEGAFDVIASSSALKVVQRGRGDILSLLDSGATVFSVADGGNITSSHSGNVDLILRSSTTNGVVNNNDSKFTLRAASSSERFDIINGAGLKLLTIASSGNVGIGTTNPTTKLDVIGNVSISGKFELSGLSAADANDVYLCRDPVTNEVTTSAAACVASSLKFKQNVQDLEHGLDWVSSLRPVTFDWKHNGSQSLGFIAEEVDEISPLLTVRQDGQVFSVNYQIVTAVLAKAVQEQQELITAIQNGYASASRNDPSTSSGQVNEPGIFERFITYLKDIVISVRGVVSDRVQTKELCIDDVCVNKEQLKELLQKNNINQPAPSPAPSPSSSPTPDPTPEPTPEVIPDPTPLESLAGDQTGQAPEPSLSEEVLPTE